MRYRVTVLDRENMPVERLGATVTDFYRALFHAEHVEYKSRLRGLPIDRVEIRDETGKLHATIYSPRFENS